MQFRRSPPAKQVQAPRICTDPCGRALTPSIPGPGIPVYANPTKFPAKRIQAPRILFYNAVRKVKFFSVYMFAYIYYD
jgi:hypothetical protein